MTGDLETHEHSSAFCTNNVPPLSTFRVSGRLVHGSLVGLAPQVQANAAKVAASLAGDRRKASPPSNRGQFPATCGARKPWRRIWCLQRSAEGEFPALSSTGTPILPDIHIDIHMYMTGLTFEGRVEPRSVHGACSHAGIMMASVIPDDLPRWRGCT